MVAVRLVFQQQVVSVCSKPRGVCTLARVYARVRGEQGGL